MTHFIMVASSVILWIAAIAISGAVGMCLEEGNRKGADTGCGLMATFAICAFILQVMA